MKDRQYFKHDASASISPKLVVLLDKEGTRGYGIYWLLLELLRQQDSFTASLDVLKGLARRLGTRAFVMHRIIENYGIFVVENGRFIPPDCAGEWTHSFTNSTI